MITTLVAIAVFIAYGLQQAQQDKGGKPNDQHAPDWQERAAFALFVAGVLTLMHQFYLVAYHDAAIDFGAMGWRFLGLCLIAYGSFSIVFQWSLNKLRKNHPLYIAPWSNVYDRVFYCSMCFVYSFGWWPDAEWVESLEGYYQKKVTVTVIDIHRAGFIAYAVEGLALLIGCGITLAH